MTARISRRAESDLDCIFAYIATHHGFTEAERFLAKAKEAATFLLQHPLAGSHPRWATRHRALRFWVISKTNYLIYYFPIKDGVSIERVLDGRRDVGRIINLGVDEPE
jgi:toxin ParE1/3/4